MGLRMSKNLEDIRNKEMEKSNSKNYFRVASDLDGDKLPTDFNNYSFGDGESRKKFLDSIVSGVSYASGDIFEGGKMILPFDRVVELYNDGFNIIRANYFNEFMVDVEFEKKIEKGRGR